MKAPRPLWRWALFCITLRLWFYFGWRSAGEVCSWCVLPEWLGHGNDCSDDGEAPF